jgi:flagellar biosynthesis protein FlhG
MTVDQATELRRMMAQVNRAGGRVEPVSTFESRKQSARRASPHATDSAAATSRARVLAVSSGKGGVGKTNVAVNLAARLATMGRRVILLDADLGLANADLLSGVRVRGNLAHVVTGRRKLPDVCCKAPGGFTLIPGASGLAAMADLAERDRARMFELLHQIEGENDLLLVDTGAGISPNVLSFVLAADEVLVVTTPEPPAIADAYALIKTIYRRRENAQVSVLVNMARDRAEARRVFDRINAVCRRFLGRSLRDAGYMVVDPKVPAAVRRRMPFALDDPPGPASECIAQLAHKLDRHAHHPNEIGFFRRVTSWLTG